MKSNLVKRKCQEHDNKQVLLACYNKYCKEKRLVCQKCNVLHSAHPEDLIDDDQIEERVQDSQSKCKQFIKQLNEKFDELTKLFKKLISQIETKFYISIERLNGFENEQFNQLLNSLIIQDEQQMNLNQIFNDGCQYFQDKIVQCQNELGLKELNFIQITKKDLEKAEQYYKQGYAYYDKNDYANAIKQFDLALNLNKNHLKSFCFKGGSLRLMNQYKESIEWYDKAILIDPKYKQALWGKGESLRLLSQYTQAIEFLDSALQIDNNYENALATKGACLIELNKLDEAEICLNKVIKLDPNYQWYQNLLKKLQDKRRLRK